MSAQPEKKTTAQVVAEIKSHVDATLEYYKDFQDEAEKTGKILLIWNKNVLARCDTIAEAKTEKQRLHRLEVSTIYPTKVQEQIAHMQVDSMIESVVGSLRASLGLTDEVSKFFIAEMKSKPLVEKFTFVQWFPRQDPKDKLIFVQGVTEAKQANDEFLAHKKKAVDSIHALGSLLYGPEFKVSQMAHYVRAYGEEKNASGALREARRDMEKAIRDFMTTYSEFRVQIGGESEADVVDTRKPIDYAKYIQIIPDLEPCFEVEHS